MPEITQEEFELFEQYKQLGSIQDLVAKQVDTTVTFAAEKTGFKKSVLQRLLRTLPDDYNLVTSEDGVFVNTPEGEVELSEFANQEWAEFMPSLKAQEERKPVPHVRQTAEARETTQKNVGKKIADNFIKQTYGWALKTDTVN